MKKIIAMLLALVMVFALVACGNADKDDGKTPDAILATEVDGPAGHMEFNGYGACTKDVYIVKVVQLEDGSFNYETITTYEDVAPNGLLPG